MSLEPQRSRARQGLRLGQIRCRFQHPRIDVVGPSSTTVPRIHPSLFGLVDPGDSTATGAADISAHGKRALQEVDGRLQLSAVECLIHVSRTFQDDIGGVGAGVLKCRLQLRGLTGGHQAVRVTVG